MPPDADIVTEAVHGASSTIDSRHFAEEFLRRKKLADKGVVVDAGPSGGATSTKTASAAAGQGTGGGWNEVAKKTSTATASAGNKGDAGGGSPETFRVVPGRKKGRR